MGSQRIFSNSDLDLLEELAIREARRSYWAFRRYMNPRMKVGWWQREISGELQSFFDDLRAELAPRLVIQAPPQHGKLLADETPVLTTRGWKRHGDLKRGDSVIGIDGQPAKVLAISPKASADYRVTLTNGEVIWCHGRHEWTVFNRNKKRMETLETVAMLESGRRSGDRHPLHTGPIGARGGRYTFQLPRGPGVVGSAKALPLDPYVLGVWLGDGSQTKPAITFAEADRAVVAEVESRGFPITREWTHASTGVQTAYFGAALSDRLRRCGVFTLEYGQRLKHIPAEYLTSSVDQRLALLAGLIDTDGYTYRGTGRVVFTTTDEALARSVEELLSSLGCSFSTVTEQPKLSSSGVQGVKPYFVVGFTPHFEIPCILARKRNVPRETRRRVAIAAIDHLPCGKVGHCITVDRADGLYLAGRTMQATHNSDQIVEFIAWLAGQMPELRTIYASFSDRLGVRANLKMQRIYDSPRYQRVFPGTRISQTNAVTISGQTLRNREIIEHIGTGGYFRNTTVRGSITGESLDLGVIDDPIKGRAEANSEATREAAWGWLTDDFLTRFSEHGALLIILTRWHVDDPVGRLREADPGLRVLTYKAIATEDERHRNAGEALFPEHKSLDFLLARKAIMTESSWESLYQQEPFLRAGGMFPIEKFHILEFPPAKADIKASVRYWDKAGTKDGDGAETAGVLMHWLRDGRFVIGHVAHGRWEALEREAKIKAWATADGYAVQVFVEQEPGSGGKESAQATVRNLAGFTVGLDRVTGDKVTRAEPYAAQVQGGNVCLVPGDWHRAFLEEHESFPNGKLKDMVDAASGALVKLTGDLYDMGALAS